MKTLLRWWKRIRNPAIQPQYSNSKSQLKTVLCIADRYGQFDYFVRNILVPSYRMLTFQQYQARTDTARFIYTASYCPEMVRGYSPASTTFLVLPGTARTVELKQIIDSLYFRGIQPCSDFPAKNTRQ